ncbi:MAG: asparaginase [Rhizobiales bacterium]|nr:asparaginase [Hyphomicrobiales bacterium]
MSENPVIAHVTRGGTIESSHTGAFAVSDMNGIIRSAAGNIDTPVFPRSAIKAFQCLPLIESGAAERFGLTDEEIALCCSSHNGEPEHLRVAASILAKAGNSEELYECGAHWPHERKDVVELASSGGEPRAIHNNCSGKHAGMLALARQLEAQPVGYVTPEHPVQIAVAKTIAQYCSVDIRSAPMGIDGCSVPTWAFPLRNMALGFARLTNPQDGAAVRIIRAARNHPFMIAGSNRFDTAIMQKVPRLFIKVGAEGVYCGCIPHAGLGFALKCDDGSIRAAEAAVSAVLLNLDVWTPEERACFDAYCHTTLKNWRGLEVGAVEGVLA